MNCPNCSTSVDGVAAFCPNCGTRFGAMESGPSASQSFAYTQPHTASMGAAAAAVGVYAQPEENIKRAVAYLIDVVPMLFLALIHLVPIFGWMIYGLLHVCYWLLRDINGASVGKLVMGSVVLSQDGAPSSTNQRILRNVPLAIPGLLGMIPLLGLFLELGFALFIFGGEAVLLLLTGRRFGDRLAGTLVFRR